MPASNHNPVHVARGDRPVPLLARSLPAVIVLDRLRSAFNTGNIFRLAEAVRAERIVACGYTPVPPHPKLAKTARGCDAVVPCSHAPNAAVAVTTLRNDGYTVYGVETATAAHSVWEARFHFPAVFLFGNEALGVSADALNQCDGLVALPCLGQKNSINVANCAAVVLYAALAQWIQSESF